ncbi:uncharacterized protein LOC108680847 [Hyalella azteca]|uniref:Uncharacterized protein LOC108680847 n=1 Tax=Hyalella azteca TaxID=294128 RepID=A0A8B7PGI0_HYAAZ|nr:uncharacterized protein LOC108680847 [Hyalella azteca]
MSKIASRVVLDNRDKKVQQDALLLHKELHRSCQFISHVTGVRCSGCSDLFTHGVHLALLAHHLVPDCVPLNKIYDRTLIRYEGAGNLPSFRHLDNINLFIRALDNLGLPKILQPECRDIYEGHNLPQLVYCLRALQYLSGFEGLQSDPHVECPPDVLERLHDCVKGCKLPPFDSVCEVLGSSHGNCIDSTSQTKQNVARFWVDPRNADKENSSEGSEIYSVPRQPPRPVLSLSNKGKAHLSSNRPPVSPKPSKLLTPRGKTNPEKWAEKKSCDDNTTPLNNQAYARSLSAQTHIKEISSAQNSETSYQQGRPVLQPLSTNESTPASMREWVQHQRQTKEAQIGTTKHVPAANFSHSFSPKSLFNQAPSLKKIDDVIGHCISENVSSFNKRNTDGEKFQHQESSFNNEIKHSAIRNTVCMEFQENATNQSASSFSKVNNIFLSGANQNVSHSRTPSSPFEFVKPLSPSYRLASQKGISVASSVCLSSSPYRTRAATLDTHNYSHRSSSSSAPSSPRKVAFVAPLSVSYDELSVVVADSQSAKNSSASSLTVLSSEAKTSREHQSVCSPGVNSSRFSLSLNEEEIHGYTGASNGGSSAAEERMSPEELVKNVNPEVSLQEQLQSDGESNVRDCLSRLYCSLQNGCESSTLAALEMLKECYPSLPPLLPHAAPLYHLEMYEAMMDAEGALSLEEVCGGVVLVGAVANINTAVRTGDERALLAALTDRSAHMQDVHTELTTEYLSSMRAAVALLAAVNDRTAVAVDQQIEEDSTTVCPLLSFLHIQQIIDQVNTAAEDRMSQLAHGEQLQVSSDEEMQHPAADVRHTAFQEAVDTDLDVHISVSPKKLRNSNFGFEQSQCHVETPLAKTRIHEDETLRVIQREEVEALDGCPYISPPMPFNSRATSELVRNASQSSMEPRRLESSFQSSFCQEVFASLSHNVASALQHQPDSDDKTEAISSGITIRREDSVEQGMQMCQKEVSVTETDLQQKSSNTLRVLSTDDIKIHQNKTLPVDDSICEALGSSTSRVESFKEGDGRRFLPQRSSTQNSSRRVPFSKPVQQPRSGAFSVLHYQEMDSISNLGSSRRDSSPCPQEPTSCGIESGQTKHESLFQHSASNDQLKSQIGSGSPGSVLSPDSIYPTPRKLNQCQQSYLSTSSDLLPSQERLSLCETLGAHVDLSSRMSGSSIGPNSVAANVARANENLYWRNYTEREVKSAVRIQKWWRLQTALSRLQQLLRRLPAEPLSTNALLQAMVPCLSILPLTRADLRTENKMQAARSGVSRCLRVTAELQKQLDELDLHIGLLLTNTMSIQDRSMASLTKEEFATLPPSCGGDASLACVSTPSKKKKDAPERRGTLTLATGLKALRKVSRDRLQGYQHLFYLLQTEPRYLATLILALPCARTTRFVESVVFSLYNYGANDRDSFLLINLFKTALEEEIRCKVLRISDIVSGEPLVVKMIVSFVRKGPGRAALREILGPLVTKIIEDKNLNLNTNPVEIYQTWLNEIEMETGESSGRPYNVSPDEALEQPMVVKRLQVTLEAITRLTNEFCSAITSSIHKLPYTLLYLAGVMRRALARRFPHIQDKEVLKVVGSLIYYRYINSGIVAPDAFDVITVGPHEQLSSRQRRNLATIAKTLQAAANKRGFGNDTPHLCALNRDLVAWHESMRTFFLSCCRVPPPDAVFAVTQYSEAALIHKPEIHLTLQELCETHNLLLAHRNVLAPSASDPLHSMLDDLPPPDMAAMGDSSGKLEVCLSLSSKFSFSEPEPTADAVANNKDAQTKLFEKSKQLVVDVLLCYDCNGVDWSKVTLQDVVSSSTSPEQEQRFTRMKTASGADSTCDSLHAAKTRLSHNLRRLQTLGLVSPTDGFQQLLLAVATDVQSQRCYRSNRGKELARLCLALSQLQQKERFLREQRDSFVTYLSACRANLMQHCAKRSRHGAGVSVTYSGKRLKEKGVLVNIRDFTPSQYSSVAFVISRVDPNAYASTKAKGEIEHQTQNGVVGAEENDNENNAVRGQDHSALVSGSGIFSVTVKYRGVVVDAVKISIQELLHLQYEGARVKQMAGGAEVNVNLLLHLLNTKFFKKKK